MNLTAGQLATLKADLLSDGTMAAQPNTPDGNSEIARLYNLVAVPDFFVYRTNVPVQDIYDQIVWANLTPADAPDGTQLWLNRAMQCQGKQFNVQIILQGQNTINAAKANVRAGLQDALTNVPSGVSGAAVAAGWVGVRDNALARKATRFEKLFKSGASGASAQFAATMVLEGAVSYQDIDAARNS